VEWDTATVRAAAEMVVNVRDGAAVEQLVSHDVVLLPKLVTVPVRPPAERQPTEQLPPSSLPSPGAVSDMHQYNNKVIGHYVALGTHT